MIVHLVKRCLKQTIEVLQYFSKMETNLAMDVYISYGLFCKFKPLDMEQVFFYMKPTLYFWIY